MRPEIKNAIDAYINGASSYRAAKDNGVPIPTLRGYLERRGLLRLESKDTQKCPCCGSIVEKSKMLQPNA